MIARGQQSTVDSRQSTVSGQRSTVNGRPPEEAHGVVTAGNPTVGWLPADRGGLSPPTTTPAGSHTKDGLSLPTGLFAPFGDDGGCTFIRLIILFY